MTGSPYHTAHVGYSNNGYFNELRHISVEYTGEYAFKLHYSTLPKIIDGKHYATTGKSRSCHTVVTRRKFGMQILVFRPPRNPYNSTQYAFACYTSAWIYAL